MITGHTREISVKNKVLKIKLDSGVLKEEFSYSKEKLIKLINDQVGKPVINSVEIY
jgi:predicted nucleic acid-binding Zn ribbon protein